MARLQRSLVMLGALVMVGGQARAQGFTGGAAVGYRIPAGAPTGEVEVLSLGAADLPVPNLLGTERFVHVRLAAANKADDRPWVLDARDQTFATTALGAGVAPRYAQPEGGSGEPRLVLKKGERGALDLFFLAGHQDPESLALRWRVRRGGEAVAGTTVFEQLPAPAGELGPTAYVHYWPSQFTGGWLLFGDLWCFPSWPPTGWLASYRDYGQYGYQTVNRGFRVSQGARSWTYEPAAPAPTVGSHWRAGNGLTAAPPPGGWHKALTATPGPPIGKPAGGWISTGTPPTQSGGWISTGAPPAPSTGGWISSGTPAASAPPPAAPTMWHVVIHAAPGDRYDARATASSRALGAQYTFDRPQSAGGAPPATSSTSTSSSSSSSSSPAAAPAAPSSVGGAWRSR
jgi:hypothetical protein